MRQLNLGNLKIERPGLSAKRGESCAEAAAVCYQHSSHDSGVVMTVDGDWAESFEVTWEPLTPVASATWADRYEAAEHGTYGVAALLAEELADLTVVERSAKGTGFDYWLGPRSADVELFQKTVRLEVSGILADGTKISSRVAKKKKQTDQSAGPLPALVIVVEFGTPRARMVNR